MTDPLIKTARIYHDHGHHSQAHATESRWTMTVGSCAARCLATDDGAGFFWSTSRRPNRWTMAAYWCWKMDGEIEIVAAARRPVGSDWRQPFAHRLAYRQPAHALSGRR